MKPDEHPALEGRPVMIGDRLAAVLPDDEAHEFFDENDDPIPQPFIVGSIHWDSSWLDASGNHRFQEDDDRHHQMGWVVAPPVGDPLDGNEWPIGECVRADVDADGKPLVHRRKSLSSMTWSWCNAEDGTLTGDQDSVTCPRCITMVRTFQREQRTNSQLRQARQYAEQEAHDSEGFRSKGAGDEYEPLPWEALEPWMTTRPDDRDWVRDRRLNLMPDVMEPAGA